MTRAPLGKAKIVDSTVDNGSSDGVVAEKKIQILRSDVESNAGSGVRGSAGRSRREPSLNAAVRQ